MRQKHLGNELMEIKRTKQMIGTFLKTPILQPNTNDNGRKVENNQKEMKKNHFRKIKELK